MGCNLGSSAQLPATVSRLESRPSEHYIDLTFPHLNNSQEFDHSPSDSEDYDSEDFIDLFPRESETLYIQTNAEKLHGAKVQSGATVDHVRPPRTTAPAAARRTASVDMFNSDIQEIMRFPRVSTDILNLEIDDFYTSLTLGLDSLDRLMDSNESWDGRLATFAFLNADFLQQSTNLLQSVTSDAQILVEKLAALRRPNLVEFREAVTEYSSISAKILQVCDALKFTMTLLKSYQNSQVEATVGALESLVSLPGTAPRAVHILKAKEAGRAIDSSRAEMTQMQKEVKKLVESEKYGSLSYFVPNLNLTNADSAFAKWSGVWGVLFAMKTVASYICQLLLAALAYAGEGPALVASTKVASFNSGWASSLMNLHIHARKQFNKMKDRRKCSCTFMSRDNQRLEYMLEDTRGHLQSLLDQGKFLNMGVYMGSWQADRKKLIHNVPLLKQHVLLLRHRLSLLSGDLECLASNMIDGQRYLSDQLSLAR